MPGGQLGLLERSDAMGAIGVALSGARAGRMSVLFVMGEAGLGKSALLGEAIRAADGFVVGQASGEASEVVLPFGLLGGALHQAGSGDVTRAASELPAAERAVAAWYRVQDWLGGADAPILLALDDLHWADGDSLALLGLLARHLEPTSLAIVATLRPWPPAAAQAVNALVAGGAARVSALSPLSQPASIELLSRITARPVGARLTKELPALCAGNPALLHQLAPIVDQLGELSQTGLDLGPGGLLLARFTGLDGASLDYARAAAVFGVSFRPSLAAALAGLDAAAARAALEALCGAGLIRAVSGHALFNHALLQEALYEDLPSPVRAQMHAAAFRLAWAHGLPAAEAARHAVAGELVGDNDAVSAVEAAGAEALTHGATATAARWLRHAVALAGDRPSPDLSRRLADALLAAGEPAEAAGVCRSMLARPGTDRLVEADVNRILARCLVRMGMLDRAEAALERAAAGARDSHRVLATEVLLEASLMTMYFSGPVRSLDFAERAAAMLPGDAEPELAAWVMAARGSARLCHARVEGAAEIEAALARLPAGSGLRGLHGAVEYGPRFQQLQAHKSLEAFEEAMADYRAAIAEAGEANTPWARTTYDVAHSHTLALLGRLAEARQTLLDALNREGNAPALGVWTCIGLASVHLEMGMLDEAARYCDRVEAMVGADGEFIPTVRLFLWPLRATLALEADDPRAARTLMARVETLAERIGAVDPIIGMWHPVAIVASLATGRDSDAQRVIDKAEVAGVGLGTRFPRAVAARGRALLAERAGDLDSAASHFAAALEWHQGLPMPLEEVETLIAYGGFLRRRRSASSARPVLTQAVDLANSCDAQRLETRALAELHAAGGRRRKHRTPDEPLSPIEQRVAELAASGKTNTEIGRQLSISVRTVELHLTHTYARLGITSRRQLRPALSNPSERPTPLL